MRKLLLVITVLILLILACKVHAVTASNNTLFFYYVVYTLSDKPSTTNVVYGNYIIYNAYPLSICMVDISSLKKVKCITLNAPGFAFRAEAPMIRARQLLLLGNTLYATVHRGGSGEGHVFAISLPSLSVEADVLIGDLEGVWLTTDGRCVYFGTTCGHVVGKICGTRLIWNKTLPFNSEGYTVYYWNGYLVSTLETAKGFIVYDASNGKMIKLVPFSSQFYAFSSIGGYLLAGSYDGWLLKVSPSLDIVDKTYLGGFIQDIKTIDNRYIVVASMNGLYVLTPTFGVVFREPGSFYVVRTVKEGNNTYIIAGDGEGIVHVYTISNGNVYQISYFKVSGIPIWISSIGIRDIIISTTTGVYLAVETNITRPTLFVWGDLEIPFNGNLTALVNRLSGFEGRNYSLAITGFKIKVTEARGVVYRTFGYVHLFAYGATTWGWGLHKDVSAHVETVDYGQYLRGVRVGSVDILFNDYFAETGVKDISVKWMWLTYSFPSIEINSHVRFVLPGAPTVDIVFPPAVVSGVAFSNGAAALEFHIVSFLLESSLTHALTGAWAPPGALITGIKWRIVKSRNEISINALLSTEMVNDLINMIDHPDKLKLVEPAVSPGKGDPVVTIGGVFPVPRSSWRYLTALPIGFPRGLAPLWKAVVMSVLNHDAVDIVKICLGENMTKKDCIKMWDRLMSNRAYLDNVRSRALGIWKYWMKAAEGEYIDKILKKFEKEHKKIGVTFSISALFPGITLRQIAQEILGSRLAQAGGIATLAIILGDVVGNAIYHPEWIFGRTVFYGVVTIPYVLVDACWGAYSPSGTHCGIYMVFGDHLNDIISKIQNNLAVRIRGVSADDVKKLLYDIITTHVITSSNTPGYYRFAGSLAIRLVNGSYVIETDSGPLYPDEILGTGTLVFVFTTYTQGFFGALGQLIYAGLHNVFHTNPTYFYDGFRAITHIAAIYIKYNVIKDPKVIAQIVENMLKVKYGNLISNVTCVPEKHYAECTIYFSVPLRRFIVTGLQHFIINGKVITTFLFIRNCTPVSYGNMSKAGYRCELVYYPPKKAPKNTVFRVEKIGIFAIPSPAYFIEYYWKIGKTAMSGIAWVNKSLEKKIGMIFGNSTIWQAYVHYGSLFNLNGTRKFRNMTLDYFITYNRSLIVQLGGGYLVPGSVYSFTVWRTLPLDVGIVRIFINGSLTYSTIPHDVRVAVYSTVTQNVSVLFHFYLGANINGSLYIAYDLGNATVNFTAYGDHVTLSPRVPIAGVVSKMLQYLPILSAKYNNTILIVVAKIIHAEYDAVKSNDIYKTWVTLPPAKHGPALLIVHVYDPYSGKNIANATVTVYALPGFVKIKSEKTNTSGIAVFIVKMFNKYEIDVSYDSYSPYESTIYVTNRTTIINVALVSNGGISISGGGGGVSGGGVTGGGGAPPAVTGRHVSKYPVIVMVMYEDGTPFQGADVTIVTSSGGKISGKTDSEGKYETYVKAGVRINITVVAHVDGKVFTHSWSNIVVTHGIYLKYIIPTYAPPPTVNKTAILVIYTVNPVDKKPVSNVKLAVIYGSRKIIKETNKSGIAVVTGLRTGTTVNVTVLSVPRGFFVMKKVYAVILRNKVNNLYIYVYNKSQISVAYVKIVVVWRDGEPISGAYVQATIHSNSKTVHVKGYTDTYGTYVLTVPNGSKIDITVTVHVGNFTWTGNRTVIAVGYVTVRFIVPRYGPPPPEHGTSLYIYVYDSMDKIFVPNIRVNVYRYYNGRAVPYASCITGKEGYCSVKVRVSTYYGINITSSRYRLILPEGWNIYITYVPPGASNWSVELTVIPRNVTTGPPTGNNTKPVTHVGNRTYEPLTVRVVTRDGVGVPRAYVTVNDENISKIVFTGWTNSDGYIPTVYVLKNHLVKICVNASRYRYYKCKLVLMNAGYFITFFVPTYSRWFSPEVAIYGLKLIAPYNYTYYSNNTILIYVIELYTNIRQSVTVTYRLYRVVGTVPENAVETWNRSYMLYLKQNRGSTDFYYRDTVKVPVNGSECFRLYAEISRYENDTDLSNNHAWSNIVCLRQPVDLYVTVYLKVVKRIRPGIKLNDIRIFPGDTEEVTVYVFTYNNMTVRDIPYRLTVTVYGPHAGTVVRKVFTGVLNGYMSVEKFNFTVPWDEKMTINATVISPEDYNPLNNIVAITVPIAYDVEIVKLSYPHVVMSGQPFTLTIDVRKNVFMRTADVLVNFTNLGLVHDYHIVLNNSTTQTIKVNVRAPVLPLSWTHPLYIENVTVKIVTLDDYPRNNIASFKIGITGKTYLYVGLAVAGLAVLLLLFALAKHHHHTLRRRRKQMFKLE
ncbi:MAG: hypothetical protein GXO26_08005 [Crenarchaeota archaeon]|nr:hypothetical protein [Thermoproteota archaeon]